MAAATVLGPALSSPLLVPLPLLAVGLPLLAVGLPLLATELRFVQLLRVLEQLLLLPLPAAAAAAAAAAAVVQFLRLEEAFPLR